METLTAAILNKKYGNIIAPHASIVVPWGWHGIVDKMLQRLHDLPTEIRAFLIVTGIVTDADGLLAVEITGMPEYMALGGMDRVGAITKAARDHAAWSCTHDSKPGWLVQTKTGPRVLCQDCQNERGIEVRRNEA